MNEVNLVGRLVRDVELRKTNTGKSVANLTLAVSKNYKNESGQYDTEFIDITVWDKIAENISKYCSKGDTVSVKGSLSIDKQSINNKNYNFLKITGNKVSFLAKSNENKKRDMER